MSDYSKSTNFTAKDGLASGDPNKRINGALFDSEFDPISTAVASKVDKVAGETGELAQFTSSGGLESAGFKAIYPIGSIYMNATDSNNPSILLGFGIWTAFGAGRVPVGLDTGDTSFDTPEETGGDKSSSHTHTTGNHTLTISQMPSHNHAISPGVTTAGGSSTDSFNGSEGYNLVTSTQFTGGNAAHNHGSTGASGGVVSNLQPYITVYMWKRTA